MGSPVAGSVSVSPELDESFEPLGSVAGRGGWRELGASSDARAVGHADLHEPGLPVGDDLAALDFGPTRALLLDRSPAELAEPFDSVYVSFYKGIGALAGCCLAGEEDVVAEAEEITSEADEK